MVCVDSFAPPPSSGTVAAALCEPCDSHHDSPYSAAGIYAGANIPRGRNALHLALVDNDSALAAKLIEEGDSTLLNMPSKEGITPLMMLAMGHCDESLLWRLLDRSGGTNVAFRSSSRWTAADYADAHRSGEVAAALRKLEVAEMARTAEYRCSVCGDVVRRHPRLAYFAERAARGEEGNALLRRFFEGGSHRQLLAPRYHQINHDRNQRKELSESLAMLDGLQEVLPDISGDWHVIDLCCGKSMTAALVSLRYPGVVVSAVDLLPERFLPHYNQVPGCGVRYVELDVLADTFVGELSRLIESHAGRPAVILGMHLCGWLSTRAIDAFAQLQAVRGIVLSPCCLPNKKDPHSPPELYRSKDGAVQYAAWSTYLETQLRSLAAPIRATVLSRSVEDIISPKNRVITAVRMSRERSVYFARLAEQAGRYDEAVEHMQAAGDFPNAELTTEERDLLSVAYKKAIDSRRVAWRVVKSQQPKEGGVGSSEWCAYAMEYRGKLEAELQTICNAILELLAKLIPRASGGESMAFYQTLKADSFSYIAEFTDGAKKIESAENARQAYAEAASIAESELAVTHPLRLGLALNRSFFLHDVLRRPEEACKTARAALEDANAELDSSADASIPIMQLLRDNITLWSSDGAQQEDRVGNH